MSRRPTLLPVLGAALAVALLAPVLSLTGVPAFWRGEFFDADCFLRLQRVFELIDTGVWFDAISERTDAPFGEELHWTRPFDLLIWLGAWPLSHAIGVRPALEWWGAAVSPLLLVPTLLILRWGMAPVLGPRAVWGGVPFFLVQPQLLWVYIVGRPDHHSLLALCAAAVFALSWRQAAGRAEPRHAAWAGTAAGLGLWIGVEGLIAAALGAGCLGLLWLWQGSAGRLRPIAAYFQGFAAVVAVALAVEYPPAAWLEPRYVKLSIVHLVLAGTAAAAWTLIARLAAAETRPTRRLAWCMAGALLPTLAMAALYPAFFGGPLVLHSAEAQAWSPTVGEMSPLLPVDRGMAAVMLSQLGLALAASGFLLLCLYLHPAERAVTAAALLPMLAYAVIGLLQSRWTSYAQLAAVFPLLLAGRDIWRWRAALRLGSGELPLRPLALGGFYSLHLFAMVAVFLAMPGEPERPPAASCRWPEVADALARDHPPAAGADILFSHMFPGPELMWRSGYRVVAAPYISNTGIADSIRVFAAADDDAARAVLRRRQAALLLVCGHDGEAREYRGEKDEYHPIVGLPHAPPGRSLHARLLRGEAPGWLQPLTLPPELDGVRLYRMVTPDGTSGTSR